MRTYLVCIQYQGDDRVQDEYRAYCNETDTDIVADMIYDLDEFSTLELDCIENWADEDDDEEEQYASVYVEDVTEDAKEWESKNDPWFLCLPILIDERQNEEHNNN